MFEIYNEDCLERMKEIEDKSINLIVSDVPYRIISGGCSKTGPKGILNHDNLLCRQGKLFEHNDIKFSEFLPDLYRVLADNSHCYLMVNGRNLKELQVEAEKVGFVFQNLLVWDKGNATPNKWYMNCCEFILFLRKGKAKNINNLGSKTILKVDNVRNKLHPTQKPVELMKILIENSSNEGDVVLDPFMGSGSTGVACLNTNRRFIGIELDKKYFEVAKESLKSVEIW